MILCRDSSFIHDIPPDQLVPNHESITVIWFDPMLAETNIDSTMLTRLRFLNDYILFCAKKSMCIEYLTRNIDKSDRIITVLHGFDILDEVYQYEQVHSILIIDSNTDENKLNVIQNNYQYSKTVEIFKEYNSMMKKLQQVIIDIEQEIVQQTEAIFDVLDQEEKALRNLRAELGPFIWRQLFKTMPHSLDARQQMIDECRSYYQGNLKELAIIDEFEQTYHTSDAIYWYTRPCFLFRLMNKALRIGDIVTLYIFRYFITDLCTNLEAASNTQLPQHVYRGSILYYDEVEKYRAGLLVATNGFLSSSRDIQVAQIFCGLDPHTGMSPSGSRNDQRQYVLFTIDIDYTQSSNIILADITNRSLFPHENEILFDIGTTFEITSVIYDCEHYVWNIQMKTSSEIAHIYQQYENYIYERMKETNVNIFFGLLWTDIGEYTQSLKYFQHLLIRTSPNDKDRSNIYYCMSRIYRFNGEYSLALNFLRRAEYIQRIKLSESKFDLARTLAGIGSVYYELHDYQQELFYYKNAMNIYREILPEYHIEIARSFNRLGFAYINQQDYIQALYYLEQSLDIYKKTVPDDHPGIGQTLTNIGVVHHALGHIDQAFAFYQTSLNILEKLLPKDHHHIAVVCYRLSIFYAEQNQYGLTILYAQRSLKIWEKKLPSTHRLIKEAQDILERYGVL
ncbi:unnamed protein product [Adineta steineri]|uniref:Uncharacterized protein n=1 Tax=Adineta steineri TaxID=433720 RepID=A0A819EBA5_9BILA|nr:unnamed protein product [Adineta steineri]CAF0743912.1 unnamed protein product [Adineta steineri]CAF3765846.1 unnamed protein product [Adineta steineri]CAF3848756.1 unnamed protein product [Adineta steineri]